MALRDGYHLLVRVSPDRPGRCSSGSTPPPTGAASFQPGRHLQRPKASGKSARRTSRASSSAHRARWRAPWRGQLGAPSRGEVAFLSSSFNSSTITCRRNLSRWASPPPPLPPPPPPPPLLFSPALASVGTATLNLFRNLPAEICVGGVFLAPLSSKQLTETFGVANYRLTI